MLTRLYQDHFVPVAFFGTVLGGVLFVFLFFTIGVVATLTLSLSGLMGYLWWSTKRSQSMATRRIVQPAIGSSSTTTWNSFQLNGPKFCYNCGTQIVRANPNQCMACGTRVTGDSGISIPLQ